MRRLLGNPGLQEEEDEILRIQFIADCILLLDAGNIETST